MVTDISRRNERRAYIIFLEGIVPTASNCTIKIIPSLLFLLHERDSFAAAENLRSFPQ
jgi:hypothetical protein